MHNYFMEVKAFQVIMLQRPERISKGCEKFGNSKFEIEEHDKYIFGNKGEK